MQLYLREILLKKSWIMKFMRMTLRDLVRHLKLVSFPSIFRLSPRAFASKLCSSRDTVSKVTWGQDSHLEVKKGETKACCGFPGGTVVKNPPANAGGLGFDPWVGKIPWGRKWQHLSPCLENPMDRGAWQATIHGVTKSRTGPSDWAHTQYQETVYQIVSYNEDCSDHHISAVSGYLTQKSFDSHLNTEGTKLSAISIKTFPTRIFVDRDDRGHRSAESVFRPKEQELGLQAQA